MGKPGRSCRWGCIFVVASVLSAMGQSGIARAYSEGIDGEFAGLPEWLRLYAGFGDDDIVHAISGKPIPIPVFEFPTKVDRCNKAKDELLASQGAGKDCFATLGLSCTESSIRIVGMQASATCEKEVLECLSWVVQADQRKEACSVEEYQSCYTRYCDVMQ